MIPLRVGSVLFVALWVSCSSNGSGESNSAEEGGGGSGGDNVGGQPMSSGGVGGLPKGAEGAAGGSGGAGGKMVSDAGVAADASLSQGGAAGAPAPNTKRFGTRMGAQLGEDQLLYSTNWPVSELNAPLATVAGIMNAFLQTKPKAARDKVLWKNSQAAYKWQPRQ